MWYKTNTNEMINLDKIEMITTGEYFNLFHICFYGIKSHDVSFTTQEERDIAYNKLQDKLLNPLSVSTHGIPFIPR